MVLFIKDKKSILNIETILNEIIINLPLQVQEEAMLCYMKTVQNDRNNSSFLGGKLECGYCDGYMFSTACYFPTGNPKKTKYQKINIFDNFSSQEPSILRKFFKN